MQTTGKASKKPVGQRVRETLIQIQILCARGAPLDKIWEVAEQGIEKSNSRH
jgi:hypothetical protein